MDAQGQSERDVVLRIESLHKRYGLIDVLRGVDLQVRSGERICIIGPSGSGKSTLLRCINFLEEFQGGYIYIHGKAIGFEKGPKGERRRAGEPRISRMRA